MKVDWTVSPDEMLAHASAVAAEADAVLRLEGIEDNPVFLFGQTANQPLKCRSAEKEKLLLTGSISPLPLHKTLTLLEQLEKQRNERFHRHELLALAKALSSSIGNLCFGTEVGVGPPKADAPVVATWLDGVRRMAGDIREAGSAVDCPSTIHLGDSRAIIEKLQPSSIDAVITSPPYPNEKDYTRTTRLELVLLGFLKTKGDLRALKHDLVRSNTRGVYQDDDDDRWVADHPEVGRIADAIESRRLELGKTSGFERMYARVTKLYFGGMKRHLESLRGVLRPGAQLAYVVGDQASYLRVLIRTGELLANIAESLGYQVIGIDLFRTRIATATKQQLREEVVVLRWNG